jgi:putative NADH-flavin reductase
MTKITVLGGTGYTGGNIAQAATARGHEVTSFSRNLPETAVDGVSYETGSLLDAAVREQAVTGADVVVASLAPRGELEGKIGEVYTQIAELAAQAGARLVVIGGFGSLRPADGAPRLAYGDEFPAEYAGEARELADFADYLQASAPAELDWLFVSPAANYGSYAPGEATGAYAIGGGIANFENAEALLSGVDFAAAVVNEIEAHTHPRSHISVTV